MRITLKPIRDKLALNKRNQTKLTKNKLILTSTKKNKTIEISTDVLKSYKKKIQPKKCAAFIIIRESESDQEL